MKLKHLNICTAEVGAAADFFVKYFGFTRIPTRAPDDVAVVHDDDGFSLLFSNFDKKSKPTYPEGFHFGFILDTREEVNRLFGRLQAAGFASKPPREMHGSWTFYFRPPGDFTLEVQCLN
ncbi:MAG TPA: VOC family protein [Opitutaceae bacterium]